MTAPVGRPSSPRPATPTPRALLRATRPGAARPRTLGRTATIPGRPPTSPLPPRVRVSPSPRAAHTANRHPGRRAVSGRAADRVVRFLRHACTRPPTIRAGVTSPDTITTRSTPSLYLSFVCLCSGDFLPYFDVTSGRLLFSRNRRAGARGGVVSCVCGIGETLGLVGESGGQVTLPVPARPHGGHVRRRIEVAGVDVRPRQRPGPASVAPRRAD